MPDLMDELATALLAGDTAAVRTLLARHPALASRLDEAIPGGDFGATALIVAVRQGNRELIDLLLAAGASIDQRSHWWAGGFHVLEHPHGLADFLLERGATLDAKSAAGLGRFDDLRRIVAADPAQVHLRAGDGQTPLHVAATVEIAAFLLEHGAEIDARDVDHESTPAQYLIREHTDVARFLVSRGAHVDLLLATALGDTERVTAMLDVHPEAIATTVTAEWFPMEDERAGGHIYLWTLGRGKTVHEVAHAFGHDALYRRLMERSPIPLQFIAACAVGDTVAAKALLAEHPDLARSLGETDLERLPLAALDNNLDGVRAMLEAGWPAGARGPRGATALHWAGYHGNVEMAREILAHHPPIDAREPVFDGTPVGWTLYGSLHREPRGEGDHAGVLELLLDAGAEVPAITPDLRGSPSALAVLGRRQR